MSRAALFSECVGCAPRFASLFKLVNLDDVMTTFWSWTGRDWVLVFIVIVLAVGLIVLRPEGHELGTDLAIGKAAGIILVVAIVGAGRLWLFIIDKRRTKR